MGRRVSVYQDVSKIGRMLKNKSRLGGKDRSGIGFRLEYMEVRMQNLFNLGKFRTKLCDYGRRIRIGVGRRSRWCVCGCTSNLFSYEVHIHTSSLEKSFHSGLEC